MADNIQLNLGSGGDKLSALDLGSNVKLQKMIQAGIQSTNNTTTTPLSPSSTYTGTWEQNTHSDVMVSCHTDTTGTLYFDFSPDGSSVNTFPVAGFNVDVGIHEFHTALKGPRYFRVRLVNGTGNQSYLRLYTYYGTFRQGNSPINSNISADSDAITVRAINSATDLAFGKFGGMSEDEKFGSVALIDTADCPVDIWAYGSDDVNSGADKTFPTSSQDIFFSSSSASDTGVLVTTSYIDLNGYEQSAEVTLNGQTPVDLGDNGFDVNRAYISGPTAPSGNIYINTANAHTAGVPNDTSTILGYIQMGYGQTQLTSFTVPINKRLRIKHIFSSIARNNGSAGSAEIHLRTREFGKTWIVKRRFFVTTAVPVNKDIAGLILPPRTNVIMRLNTVSDSDTNCNTSFIYELVDV